MWQFLTALAADYFDKYLKCSSLDRSPELIAKSIIDLALTLRNESHDVSVSNIIVGNDNDSLSKKES